MENGEIINKVASSGLITFNLADYYTRGERVVLDIGDWLYMGMILKEKEFREHVKTHDWQQYSGKCLALICTVDAIIPTWAYMLLATKIQPVTEHFILGSLQELETELFLRALNKINFREFDGEKIVIKGCSDVKVPESVYVELTRRIMPHAAKIMFGEPCSTVPLFKR